MIAAVYARKGSPPARMFDIRRIIDVGVAALLLTGCATAKPTGWVFTIPGSAAMVGATDRDGCERSRAAAATARLAAMSGLTGMTPNEMSTAMAAMNPPLLLVGDCQPVAVTTP
jgi:hypothetical protein